MSVTIQIRKEEDFVKFMNVHDFQMDDLGEGIYRAVREDELPVFINIDEDSMYFEVDLGNISAVADKNLYFKLLDLNTEIQPVSLGINNSNPDDPRLVLVERRETSNLDDNEVLSVFDAFELAADKAEEVLASTLS